MEIKIGKSARACQTCQRDFVHDEELTSLVRIQQQVLVREDYCAQCWSAGTGHGSFSVWTAHFYDAKVAEQQPPEVFSPLRQLFYDAVESEDRSELAVAYLAAQLLRRQKVFRLLKESDDTEQVRLALFTDRLADRLIEVRDPNLTFGEMERARQVLLERLNRLENPQLEEEIVDADAAQG